MNLAFWPVPVLLRLTLLAIALSSMMQAQHRSTVKASPSAAPTSSAQQLVALVLSQQKALQGGDPATIASASRPLVAHLLREVAKLRLLDGRPKEAIDLDRESIRMEDSVETRLELASTLLRTGNQKDASSEAEAVLKSDPSNALAWAILGSALLSLDDKGAADAYSHSLKIKPDVNVAYALGCALLAIHEKEKADRIFQQIIVASGDAAIWHVAAGDAYREAKYLTDAVGEFKKAIAIDPRVGHSEFFLGFTYLQMNEWGPDSQSFAHLRAAVRLAPQEYLSNFYLGAIESTDGSDLASSNRHLHVAAQASPTSPEVWLYLGLNAAREKNTSEAKTYLRRAIELTGDDEARNNYQIRRVYAVLGRILISEGDRDEGEALLAKYRRTEQQSIGNSANTIARAAVADTIAPPLSGTPATKASFPGMSSGSTFATPGAAAISGTHREGIKQQQTAEERREIAASELQFGTLLASSFNDLGTAQARQGQHAEALAYFQAAEHWQPPTAILLHNLGVAAFRIGDFSESARALSLYLKSKQETGKDPALDERSRMMLAMSLFSLGKFTEADETFSSISAQTLQDSRAAYSWAYSLAHSGQPGRANQIAESLTKQGLPSDVLSLVCHLYMDTENYERSASCFRMAYQADPTLKLAHYQTAESLIRLDRPAEAVAELRQELVLSPSDPNVKYSLAFALLQSSQKSEAMTILRDLTTSTPTHAAAQYQFGKALLEQGDVAGAVQHLELAEQSDPTPDYVHYQLQAAYRKMGRVADADRELGVYSDIKSRKRDVSPYHP